MSYRLALLASLAAAVAIAVAAAPPGAAVTAADSCLRGEWRMGPAASTEMLQQLVGSAQFRVTGGTLVAAFDERNGQYGSSAYRIEATFGDLTMKARGTFLNVFRYTTRNGRLVLLGGTSRDRMSALTATVDGRTVTIPGRGAITRRIPSGGSVPYTCTRTTLRWRLPLNDTTAVFRRAR